VSLSYASRSLLHASGRRTSVLNDVSVDVFAGKTVALVGPSGSGKSSLARCILAIERPEAGQIFYRGPDLLTMSREGLKGARREIHLIFQEAAAALNPSFSVEQIVSEPITIQQLAGTQDERRTTVRVALERAELSLELLTRRPHEL